MLTQKIFELVECVCRSVRKKDQCFGGLQVIGCGDFKQLPPVPDKFLNDKGKHCFESSMFQSTFPHHVNLTKVIRQTDQDLALAVKELCDGSPSEQTIQLLKSLDKDLDRPDVVRLYGTNFDVRYVNEEMLDMIDKEAYVFKATDEGI
ncbi:uncharacterized protein LOC132714318 [Ruditapes philippinarum]|uniref:uncharacterized protein LOC132714318 n=1 Tax=Ruditapes philippinarum TaxID=129788 RepID=UPI00295ADFD3|nr:uncharacterized protein LOC132714318 [Ruditapes philippinarum]